MTRANEYRIGFIKALSVGVKLAVSGAFDDARESLAIAHKLLQAYAGTDTEAVDVAELLELSDMHMGATVRVLRLEKIIADRVVLS